MEQITINDLPVGRSVDETLRLIDAFQFTDKYGEVRPFSPSKTYPSIAHTDQQPHQVCPANWNPGDETIKATPQGNKAYLEKVHADTKMSDVAKTNGMAFPLCSTL